MPAIEFSRTHSYLPADDGISLPVILNNGAERVKLLEHTARPLPQRCCGVIAADCRSAAVRNRKQRLPSPYSSYPLSEWRVIRPEQGKQRPQTADL